MINDKSLNEIMDLGYEVNLQCKRFREKGTTQFRVEAQRIRKVGEDESSYLDFKLSRSFAKDLVVEGDNFEGVTAKLLMQIKKIESEQISLQDIMAAYLRKE